MIPVDQEAKNLEELFTEDTRRFFYELGMAATVLGKKFESNLLFFNLMEADPEAAYPLLGLGYCRIMAGSFGEAHTLLSDPRVTQSPLAGVGVSLRALAFHLEGREAEKQKLLEEMGQASSGAVGTMVSSLKNTTR